MALTSLSVVKTHLGISDSSQDTLLSQLISQVDAIMLASLKRNIEQATYTDYLSGDGTPILTLRHYPVTSITTLHLDDAGYFGFGAESFATANLLESGVDYALMRESSTGSSAGLVRRINGIWPSPEWRAANQLSALPLGAAGNVRAVYVAGYATVPADLQLAATQVVAQIKVSAQFGGDIQSANYEDAGFSRMAATEALSQIGSVASILKRYRAIAI